MPQVSYLTPKELAQRWQIPENRLAQWRWRGCLPLTYQKFGRTVRYRLTDIEAFEQKADRKSTSDTGREA